MLILWWQANVVVKEKRARLTEYGLQSIYSDPELSDAETPGAENMSRWLAPEMAGATPGSGAVVEKWGDVFSFGMVAFEIFAGKVPFSGKKTCMVLEKIKNGDRPNIQILRLSSETKNLIGRCWDQEPRQRPNIGAVVLELKGGEGEGEEAEEGEVKRKKWFCGIL